jgi:anaerobic magnesium-protoporphyrin IX monomethyl ester cyclase
MSNVIHAKKLVQFGTNSQGSSPVHVGKGTRITLTRCPVVVSRSGLNAGLLCPPLSNAYLAAAAREHGYTVTIIDPVGEAPSEVHEIPGRNAVTYGWNLDRIVQEIPEDSKYIGVSCMFSHEWPLSKQLLELIRKRFAQATIICGGEHITAATEISMRECPAINYAVLGEGEETLVDLLNTLQRKEDPAQVPGLFFLRDGVPVRTGHRERLKNIDAIPRPAWDITPVENYLANRMSFGVSAGRTMPILATRGCPYQCTFCSNPVMWTTRWYARTPQDVADEIESYVRLYNADNFDFYDLTAILKKDWIKEFSRELIDRKLNITWQLPAGTRSEAIDEDVARLLADSGHRNLVYAPETGSDKMLKDIKKKVHLPAMSESMRGAIRAGISIKLNMIFGFPDETRKDLWLSLVYLAKMAWLGVDDVTIATFVPYPGSQIFEDLRKSGRIPELDDDFYYQLVAYGDAKNASSYAKHLSSRELLTYRLGGMLLFYSLSYLLRPQRLFQTMWHLYRHDHRTRIEKALDSLLSAFRSRRPRETLAPAPVESQPVARD